MVPSAFRGVMRTMNSPGNSMDATPSCATVTMRSTTFPSTTTAPLPGFTATPPLPGNTSSVESAGVSTTGETAGVVTGVVTGTTGFGTSVVVVGVVVDGVVAGVVGNCGDTGADGATTTACVLTVATAPGPAEFTARTPTW